MRILGLIVKWAVLVFAFLILIAIVPPFLPQIPFTLAFGWIGFLRDNLAAMEVNPLLVAEAVACVVALGFGGHWFARWLYREMAPDATVPWRPGWTVAGLGAVLLLFVAGIATIGITHQTAWLFTAKAPFLEDSWSTRSRVSMALLEGSSLKGAVTESFEKTGQLPASNLEAGLIAPIRSTREIQSAAIGPGGVVRIEVTEYVAGGGEITLTPRPEAGRLKWGCSTTLPPKFVPAECRQVSPRPISAK